MPARWKIAEAYRIQTGSLDLFKACVNIYLFAVVIGTVSLFVLFFLVDYVQLLRYEYKMKKQVITAEIHNDLG